MLFLFYFAPLPNYKCRQLKSLFPLVISLLVPFCHIAAKYLVFRGWLYVACFVQLTTPPLPHSITGYGQPHNTIQQYLTMTNGA